MVQALDGEAPGFGFFVIFGVDLQAFGQVRLDALGRGAGGGLGAGASLPELVVYSS